MRVFRILEEKGRHAFTGVFLKDRHCDKSLESVSEVYTHRRGRGNGEGEGGVYDERLRDIEPRLTLNQHRQDMCKGLI